MRISDYRPSEIVENMQRQIDGILRELRGEEFVVPVSWVTRPASRKTISLLMAREYATHQQISFVCRKNWMTEVQNEVQLSRIHVHHARNALRPLGVKIQNSKGIGFFISPADKRRLRELAISQQFCPCEDIRLAAIGLAVAA